MHAKQFILLPLLAAAATHAAVIGTFQTFTNNACDSSLGVGGKEDIHDDITNCIGTEGRNAFIMIYDDETYNADVEAIDTAGCDLEGAWSTVTGISNGTCVAINTGRNWMSALVSLDEK
ncbi:hypothetical protein PRZ48_013229 [Zasmidium cellare]|uniref:Uncharacterized protein n=1 Tax=Zasmidium cellare TaxID=395010 RepID=A0ABR0E3H0_ZASCE|nr:hypothetical protein PRZ48_013229 [Zasmidium cellare]